MTPEERHERVGEVFLAACQRTGAERDLAIDNNAAENALRRVALGRKNRLFCGSDNGGKRTANPPCGSPYAY